ncbi:SUKH-4 family immunity protein [Kitasatospora cineracea]
MGGIDRAVELLEVHLAPAVSEGLGLAAAARAATPIGGAGREREGARWVGDDYGTNLWVEDGSGAVVSAMPGVVERRFVNSGFDRFTACLDLFGRWVAVMEAGGEPEPPDEDEVDALARGLASVDGAALEGPDHWWSLVIEQIRDGLI